MSPVRLVGCAAVIFRGAPGQPPEKLKCHHAWMIEGDSVTHDDQVPGATRWPMHCAPWFENDHVGGFVAWPL